ncbi:multimeric flavodoxin WrbA [Clostridium tetanomorphum]|uniref:Flavodoxin family protein n=1 Tax=Clostridium tetanomorphum TaxID=1553 RepID=A0A923E763_CLOTT|nr:NAD(P)H-dependent oxidoreductase [Clostridium tetanomorphum]MBC2396487.1 flavodoxin family protein [Clostridium tetanomorphum]NRS84889.1 multimeric flavodoxin WrbA [Clostridium tetanomorphum]NRZ98105.1 multimeric flavodoxin WrbA [Clostridium tetanomorphum]SQB91595.1 iron-sulfur flavoprotein [Clostridium tetanomorphum]
MKTLIFFASPNRNGNTYKLVEKFIQGIGKESVDMINVYNKKILPCVDCKYCYNEEKCAIKDDMTEIYEKINRSDVIVIASPMYFSSVTAPMKALIDRLQVYWSKKYIRKDRSNIKDKRAVLICTAGSYWDDMFLPLEAVLNHGFAAMDAKNMEKIYAVNTDKIPVEKNEKILKEAYELGVKLRQEFEHKYE